ncbi:hypothetical protein OCF11_21470 [Bacillus cereus]|nr:hypothetical protein [Bacillus cereus]
MIVNILLIVVFAVVGVVIPIKPPMKVQAVNISKKIIGSVELQFIAVLIDSFVKYRISKPTQMNEKIKDHKFIVCFMIAPLLT